MATTRSSITRLLRAAISHRAATTSPFPPHNNFHRPLHTFTPTTPLSFLRSRPSNLPTPNFQLFSTSQRGRPRATESKLRRLLRLFSTPRRGRPRATKSILRRFLRFSASCTLKAAVFTCKLIFWCWAFIAVLENFRQSLGDGTGTKFNGSLPNFFREGHSLVVEGIITVKEPFYIEYCFSATEVLTEPQELAAAMEWNSYILAEKLSVTEEGEKQNVSEEKQNITKEDKLNGEDGEKLNVAEEEKQNVAEEEKQNVTVENKLNVEDGDQLNVAEEEKQNVSVEDKLNVEDDDKLNLANRKQNVSQEGKQNVASEEPEVAVDRCTIPSDKILNDVADQPEVKFCPDGLVFEGRVNESRGFSLICKALSSLMIRIALGYFKGLTDALQEGHSIIFESSVKLIEHESKEEDESGKSVMVKVLGNERHFSAEVLAKHDRRKYVPQNEVGESSV